MRNRRAGTPPCTVVSAAAMKGKAASLISNGGVDDQCQQLACTRAGDRELRPLVADRGELHVEIGPQHLMAELHVLVDARRVGGGGGHEEAVGAEPGGGAVVHDEAVLAQHHAVAGAADGEGGEGVDVEAVEEGAGVGALHVDLAERGDVAEADRGAHRRHLAADGGEPVGLARPADSIVRAARRRSRRTPRPAARPRACVGVRRVGRKSLPR